MTTSGTDDRSAKRARALDESIAAETQLAPPDLPPNVHPNRAMESHLARPTRRPVALAGVVENGLIRLLDPGVKLPEHARVIIVTSEGV